MNELVHPVIPCSERVSEEVINYRNQEIISDKLQAEREVSAKFNKVKHK
jgi:hypothetical protein